ncbi:MAG: hypothetical protein AAGF30_06695 [Pseudomonadota bacterium]
MLNAFDTFIADEAGAVTVDWVVLTAALVGLGLAVMSVVREGVADLTGNISDSLCNIEIGTALNADGSGGTTLNQNGGGC